MERIVIFAGGLNYAVRKALAELGGDNAGTHWLIVHHAPPLSWRRVARNQWRLLLRNGWRWLPHLARLTLQQLRSRQPPRAGAPGSQYEWDRIVANPKIRYLRVADIHAPSTLQAVAAFAPDLGIALNAPILRPSLFKLPVCGTINLHKGKLPDYRGLPPAFWEFFHSEREVGCTVHRIDERLDTGPILLEHRLPIANYATVGALQLALDEWGIRLVREAVRRIDNGNIDPQPQSGGGRTFRMPTLKQQRDVERKHPAECAAPTVRNWSKNALYWSYGRIIGPLSRPVLAAQRRQRVVVLLYHRVNDDMRDALTVGIEQFHRQMVWLNRHCTPISLEQLVRGETPRDGLRPLVAVTFDDGYRDNYENAVPILLREQIPAAFFVSTGLMDNDIGFAHDRERRGATLPTMSWHQLRHMRELGFTIGSHTATHINCGRLPEEAIRAELVASRDTLRERLGVEDVMFAYPFGRREDITPRVRGMVKALGFTACLSAYGGTIVSRFDPFDIPREGIDHGFNMTAFRAKVEGFSSARTSKSRSLMPVPLARPSQAEP